MNPFLAEIRIFPFTFAPQGWALCNGQLLPITQNTALFALLGTMYGGDGKTTFALPDLRDRAPMAFGAGNGVTERFQGEMGGEEAVALIPSEIPPHTHTLRGVTTIAEVSSPTANAPLSRSVGKAAYHAPDGSMTTMAPAAVSATGSDSPHNNLMPYLVFSFCIALQGVFPPRG